MMSIVYLMCFCMIACSDARPLNISLKDYPRTLVDGPCGRETVIELPRKPITSTAGTPLIGHTPWSNITSGVSKVLSTPSSLAEIAKSLKDDSSIQKVFDDNLEYETEIITEIYYEMETVSNSALVDLNAPQADQNVETVTTDDSFLVTYDNEFSSEADDGSTSIPQIDSKSIQVGDDPSINPSPDYYSIESDNIHTSTDDPSFHYYEEYVDSGALSEKDEPEVVRKDEPGYVVLNMNEPPFPMPMPPLYFPGLVNDRPSRGLIVLRTSGANTCLYTSSSFLLLLAFLILVLDDF